MEKYDEEEFERAIIKQRYNFWLEKRINYSNSANEILERISEGYDPNEADVFELCCDNEEQIRQYRAMYELKQRVKGGKISKKDFAILIKEIGLENDIMGSKLKDEFINLGILVDEYEDVDLERKL